MCQEVEAGAVRAGRLDLVQRIASLKPLLSRAAASRAERETCHFPKCDRGTVENSHAIQMSGPLASLANSRNRVTTPTWRKDSGLILDEVPIRSATTFPGYCSEHEEEFQVWEKHSQITTQKDELLQAMRSVDWEAYSAQRGLAVKATLDPLVEVLVEVSVELGEPLLTVMFEARKRISDWSSKVGIKRGRLAMLRTDILTGLGLAQSAFGPAVVSAYRLQERFPVALSGSALMDYTFDGRALSSLLLVVLLPNANDTLLMLCTESVDESWLRLYEQRYFDDVDRRKESIEKWMLDGTFNWAVSPDWWRGLPAATRQCAEERLRDFESSDGAAPMGLFDPRA